VFSINLPPLRERKEDIAHLAMHFIRKHGHRTQGAELSADIVTRLQAYDWPGNVRELENVTERALVLAGNGPLKPAHFPLDPNPPSEPLTPSQDSPVPIGPMAPVVEALEARMISDALTQTGGNKPKAAALLDISERSLWYKLKKYKL